VKNASILSVSMLTTLVTASAVVSPSVRSKASWHHFVPLPVDLG
jgi:hypothetical protein